VTTTSIYLERIDSAKNMVREWGRIGRGGQCREHWCASAEEAAAMLEARKIERMKRDYA
jgi:predicted DNA-binding WGR domain protein